MKDFKFLSALALTGMLSAGIAGTTLAAGNTDWTKVLKQGSLNPTVVDKDVVGYLLTDKDDKVTVEEMLGLAGYTSLKLNDETSEAASDRTVTTGANYVAGNKTEKRHVVVYNEVNEDGVVNTDDVKYTLDIITGAVDAEDLQKEAADVEHNGKVTTDDVKRMLKFQTGEVSTPVDPVPAGVSDTEELACDIVINGNNVINAENNNKSDIVIALKSGRVEKATTYQLKWVDKAGKEEEPIKVSGGLTMSQYANQLSKSNVDLSALLEKDNPVLDREVTLRLYDNSGKVLVGETVVTINTHRPEAIKISATRVNTENATLSFEGYEDSDVVKAYYKVSDSKIATVDALLKDKDVKEITGLSNKCDNQAIEGTYKTTKGTKVYFVVEDSNGNRSQNVYTAVVPTDDVNIKQEEAPKGAGDTFYKDKVNVDGNLKATWDTIANTNKYTVRVLDENGKVVKEYRDVAEKDKDLSADLKEAGKYTVEVFVQGKADGSTLDSEAIKSDTFEIKQLAPVTSVTMEEGRSDNSAFVKWEDAKHENDGATNYLITLEEFDGKEWKQVSSIEVPLNQRDANLNGVNPNKLYRASVTVLADDTDKDLLSSEKVTSEEYFKIGSGIVTVEQASTTDTSVTLKVNLAQLKDLGERDYTYTVEIHKPLELDDTLYGKENKDEYTTRTVTPDKDGKIVIDGLAENTEYVFVVRIQTGNVIAETSRKANALSETTKLTAPVVKGTVAASKQEALEDSTKVYADGHDVLVVNGTEYDLTEDYSDPDALLKVAEKLIPCLHAGDVVNSIQKDTVDVKVDSKASTGASPIALVLTDTNVTTVKVSGNDNNQTISSITWPDVDGDKTLELSDGLFTVGTLSGTTVKLSDGAHVTTTGTGTVTLEAGANDITVNGVSVYAGSGVVLNANGANYEFEPAGENDIKINNETGKEITVKFKGNAKLGQKTLGKVTIESNAGVAVKTQAEGRLDADLSVNVTEGGTINVQDQGISSLDLTVSNSDSKTSTVNAYAKNALPAEFQGIAKKGLEIREYSNEELQDLTFTDELKAYNKTDAEKLRTYLEDFRPLFGKGIILQAASTTSQAITLTIPKGVSVNLSEVIDTLAK